MKYYIEITLIDGELPFYQIWSKLLNQLHIALVDFACDADSQKIGISFPKYQFRETSERTFAFLGDKLRVFAHSHEELLKLGLDKWLSRLGDYVHIKAIKAVPEHHDWVIVRRYRRRSLERMAHEFAQYKGISVKEALEHCQKHRQSAKPYPFIQLTSQTNEQPYRLSICQERADSEQQGDFNTYGLNNMTDAVTVPHW